MKINSDMNEHEIYKEISLRFKQTRIDSSITREELSDKAMVSVGTIARFESGKDIGLKNLVKLLMTLNMYGHIDELIPDPFDRPSYHMPNYNVRKRASKIKKRSDWKWGDEE